MAIKALTGLAPFTFTPEGDDVEDATKFKLKPFNGEQYNDVHFDLNMDEQGHMRITGKGIIKALAYGLVGWENFKDESGNDIEFIPENFKLIPGNVRLKIASKLVTSSIIGEVQEKN